MARVEQATRRDWVQTFLGRRFHPLDPRPEDVDVKDIARALSHQCRFGGMVSRYYSVAQHCVYVSLACDPKDALWGLLHDAGEAYLLDIPSPVKYQPELQGYRDAEALVMTAVCEHFGLPTKMPESVHKADQRLLVAEAIHLKSPLDPEWRIWLEGIDPWPHGIYPLGPTDAETAFLIRYEDLIEARSAG